jgi:hypothetical protein
MSSCIKGKKSKLSLHLQGISVSSKSGESNTEIPIIVEQLKQDLMP